MATPVFEEFDPASDCDCPECVHRRRTISSSSFTNSNPLGVRRALAVAKVTVTAVTAVTAVGAGGAVPALAAPQEAPGPGVPTADEPPSPQGARASGRPAGVVRTPSTTRAEIIRRAGEWVSAGVPYSITGYWSDGYRQDCSGFVSMAWNLPGSEWTGSLDNFGTRISKEEIGPGDILLFHNPASPQNGSHVVIFGGWTDYTHTYYIAYEQTRPAARRQVTPYAYWNHSDGYAAYRYRGLAADPATQSESEDGDEQLTPGSEAAAPYPGPSAFGPGANNKYVTQLGRLLVARGGARFYTSGPGPRWSEADRRATEAFQRAQGWRGTVADGLPGPRTWRLLTTGTGNDIPPAANQESDPAPTPQAPVPVPVPVPPVRGYPAAPAASPASAAYPGRDRFRPGADNAHVTELGRRLAEKGFGRFYAMGPGPRWGEADRRAVEAFQRAQGWRGGAVDGYPGPETWRRLFR